MNSLRVATVAVLLSVAASLGAQLPPPTAQIDFFIHGHEDDWQLFLAPAVFAARSAGHRLVFIYATAGDNGDVAAYWQARHAPDIDAADYNYKDHADHHSIGVAVSQLTPIPGVAWSHEWYMDYNSRAQPINVDLATFQIKTSSYLVYDNTMETTWGKTPLRNGDYDKYASWLYRYYHRASTVFTDMKAPPKCP